MGVGMGVVVTLVCSVYKSELEVVTARVTNVPNFFSLATNIPCFSLVKILLILPLTTCKSENLGASYLQGIFLKVKPCM